ncbi:hypothetical protein GPJ56_011017 [Histomonas meleagridis]|uniref:uncharacterized protein n=1 Tax=Histomonas meleagridis TaxID=135588 RepID=UPI0035594EE7|nr:hypothetical protein GPJ56_011017 [Histomonas meleagridis]KAH0800794.1 hypothetical protein GO595_006547 [Histomonas meleagridis]
MPKIRQIIGIAEIYIITLFMSSLILFIAYGIAVSTPTNIETSKCESPPKVTLYKSVDHSYLTKIINSAKKRIIFVTGNMSMTSFQYIKEPLLVDAKTRLGESNIKFVISNQNSQISSFLNSYFPNNVIVTDQFEIPIYFPVFIVDDTAYLTSSIFSSYEGTSTHSSSQIIIIENCSQLIDDITAFVDSYEAKSKNPELFTYPEIIEYIGKSSPILPAKCGNTTSFFINNPSHVLPLKINTSLYLTEFFKTPPKELLIYTFSTQTSEENFYDDDFSFHVLLKSLQIYNHTKIRYLASSSFALNDEMYKWCRSFVSFSNSRLSLYSSDFDGPNFIVADNTSMLFSHEIRTFEIEKYASMHLVTDDANVNHELREFFDEIWNDDSTHEFKVNWN